MTLLALLVVLLLVGGVMALAGVFSGAGTSGSDAVAVDEASCPSWATPPRSSPPSPRTRRPPTPVLTAELAPLLAAPALGAGASAHVVDVADGTVLLDQDGAAPATPASTAKLLTAVAALTFEPSDTIETTVVAGAVPGVVSWAAVTRRCPGPRPPRPTPVRRRSPTSPPR